MTKLILKLFLNRWDLFAHFTTAYAGVLTISLFLPLWWAVAIVFVLTTAKEMVEWAARKYLGVMDLVYNALGIICGIIIMMI